MDDALFRRSLLQTLRFTFHDAGVTTLEPRHRTTWRHMPWLVLVQIRGGGLTVRIGGDSAPLTVADGECLLAPNLEHQTSLASDTRAVSRWLHADFRVMGTVDVFSLYHVPRVLRGTVAHELGDLSEQLAQLAHRPGSDIATAARMQQAGFRTLALILQQSTPLEPDCSPHVRLWVQDRSSFRGLAAGRKC